MVDWKHWDKDKSLTREIWKEANFFTETGKLIHLLECVAILLALVYIHRKPFFGLC